MSIRLRWLWRTIRRRRFSVRNLRSRQDGATTLEFSLLLLPFLFLTGAYLDVGMTMFQSIVMESAVQRVGREIRVGTTQSKYNETKATVTSSCPGCTVAQIEEKVIAEMIKYMKGQICVEAEPVGCDNISVDVRNYQDFATTNPPELALDANGIVTNAVFEPTGNKNVVVIRVVQPFSYVTGFMSVLGAQGSADVPYHLHTVLLHTEPFE